MKTFQPPVMSFDKFAKSYIFFIVLPQIVFGIRRSVADSSAIYTDSNKFRLQP